MQVQKIFMHFIDNTIQKLGGIVNLLVYVIEIRYNLSNINK